MLNMVPTVPAMSKSMAPNWAIPGSITNSGLAKTPPMSTKRTLHSWIPLNIVPMKSASAIFDVTAATREVGGVSSPQTATKKAKKWITQGLMPTFVMVGAITKARRM